MKKQIFTLVLLGLMCSVGSVWADCSTAGTIYKFACKASLTSNTNIEDNPVTITTSNYLASFEGSTGASLTAYNDSKNFQIASNGMKLANKSKSYLILNLGECTLKKGDIVKTKITSQNAKLMTATSDGSEILSISKNNNVQTLTIGADWDDNSTIYLIASSNGAIVYSMEIIRPATITLDATTNEGIAVDAIKGEIGEIISLPHATKDNCIFSGWFENASGGDPVDNPYTITGSTTLYAQFNEACPESGTIYKFQVKTGLTNGNISTVVPKDIVATTSNYLSSLVGGGLTIAARNNVNRVQIVNNNAIGFANGAEAFLEMDIDCGVQEGDTIKYTIASNNMELMAGSENESTNKMTLTKGENQKVIVDSKLVGADKLFMKRSSSSPNISYFEIYRPVRHALAWDFDGGSSSETAGTNYTAAGQVIEGATITYPSDASMSKDGFDFDGWSSSATEMPSGDLTIKALWKVAVDKYTVVYKDGETELKSVEVEVGSAPESYTPTKDCYTFAAWQKNAADYDPADLASDAVADETITLTARWTPIYANGNYTFDNTATVGTNPSMTVSTTSTSYEAFRVDNLFFSGMTIQLEEGTDGDGDNYRGWKVKSSGTIKFVVEKNKSITVGLGSIGGGSAKVSYTNLAGVKQSDVSLSAATNNIIMAKGGEMVTISLAPSSGKSVTLKKIFITDCVSLSDVDATEYGFATFCGDNSFTVSGATAYKASLSGTTLTLTSLGDTKIPATNGVILVGDPGEVATINYTSIGTAADMDGNDLLGTTIRTLSTSLLAGGADKVMVLDKTDNTFKSYTGAGKYIPANKAYLLYDEPEGAPSAIRIEFGENNATNMGNIKATDEAVKFIQDGKLFIKRNGVVYDAVGRVIR